MKKLFQNTIPILFFFIIFNAVYSQNVGIGNESFTPDPSAILEVKATDKGMLVPRVDITDLSTAAPVTNPALSLLVYNTNETTGEGFYYWNGTEWKKLITEDDAASIDGSETIITAGTNVTVSGTGTTLDPYIITATSSGTADPCNGETSVTYQNQTYAIVAIGSQCWFQENLNVSQNPAGTNITKKCYNNIAQNCIDYGGLYTWNVAMNNASQSFTIPSGRRGICPPGWHIPSELEWDLLIHHVASSKDRAAIHLKETGTTYWNSPNFAINSSGFSARGSGWEHSNGNKVGFKSSTRFWTTTMWYSNNTNETSAYYIELYSYLPDVRIELDSKSYFYSVRCLKD